MDVDTFQDPAVLPQRVRRRMNDMLKNKHSDDEILAAALDMGMAEGPARPLLEEVKVQRVADKRKAALRGAMIGGVWLAISGAILISLFVTKSPMVLHFRIIWAAAGFGVFLIVTNLVAWRNAKP